MVPKLRDVQISCQLAARSRVPSRGRTSNQELELALIARLDRTTEPGSTIAVNLWTGATLAYALADRDTTYKHVLSNSSADD